MAPSATQRLANFIDMVVVQIALAASGKSASLVAVVAAARIVGFDVALEAQ